MVAPRRLEIDQRWRVLAVHYRCKVVVGEDGDVSKADYKRAKREQQAQARGHCAAAQSRQPQTKTP